MMSTESKAPRWAWVPGFGRSLEASDQGEIVLWFVRLNSRFDSIPEKLEHKRDAAGYNLVFLFGHWLRVDHLIMRAFVGLEADRADVVHVNGDLSDDSLGNLNLVPWPEED